MTLGDSRAAIGMGPTFLGDAKGAEDTAETTIGRRPKRLGEGKGMLIMVGIVESAVVSEVERPKRLGDANGVNGGIAESEVGRRPKRLGDAKGANGDSPKSLGEAKEFETMWYR
jgi:hypothetical protein